MRIAFSSKTKNLSLIINFLLFRTAARDPQSPSIYPAIHARFGGNECPGKLQNPGDAQGYTCIRQSPIVAPQSCPTTPLNLITNDQWLLKKHIENIKQFQKYSLNVSEKIKSCNLPLYESNKPTSLPQKIQGIDSK